ncbi:MAG: glycosyltransferase family 1 protein [Chromatiales bacterium]|jgi:glycosyltransferase involved in cell wall biosynthesis
MDIGIVTETYPPEINGVARTLRQMVDGLRTRGHRISLVRPRQTRHDSATRDGETLREILVPGIALPRYRDLRFGLPWPGALRRAWKGNPPDVVYVATEGPLGHSALCAAERLGVPAVSGYHTNFPRYSRHYGLGLLEDPIWRLLRRFHNRGRLTLAPTEHLARELRRKGIGNVRVFPRGVDTELFHPGRRRTELRSRWGLAEDGLAVLYVGRLAAEKNLGLAVETFRGIQADHPGARFILVGDGPQQARMQRDYPELVFTGPKTGASLAEHYASGDLFLFPSTTETFGNVVLEAMASGLSVVAYDYAAAGLHLRHGDSGMLAVFDDEADFVRCAVSVADNRLLAERLRRRARATAEGLGWPRLIAELEDLLCQASDPPQGREASDARLAATNE